MNFAKDTITHGSLATGIQTFTVGFQPLEAELIVTPAPGAAAADVYSSRGDTDGTTHTCDTFTVLGSRRYQRRYTDRMASIEEWNGSAWVEVFKITFNSFTATQFKYNVVIGNASYQVERRVRG